MALRLAERQRNFRKLSRRAYTTELRVAEFSRIDGDSLRLEFGPGLSVLCGLNGAGKSSTLASLWICLSGGGEWPEHLPRVPEWLSQLQISGVSSGEEWGLNFDFAAGVGGNSGFDAPVEYIDPSSETERILNHIRRDDNPADLLEGIDPATFDDRARSLLSFLVGREYDSVSVYEITSFSEEDLALPFFVVSSRGATYNSLRMGRGEINAAYMLWRLGLCEPGSVVLLEEPDTHLAHVSQSSLIDVIVSIVVERDLTIVASSHAPGFFRRLPDAHTSLLTSLPRPRIDSGLSTSKVAEHLGLDVETGPLIVVEDPVGEIVMRTLLYELGSSSIKAAPIRFASNGESGVSRVLLELTDGGREDGHVIAVYDGDQRLSAQAGTLFLMGNESPEREIRKMVKRWEAGEFADWVPDVFGGNDEFEMLLQRLDGLDDHDWLEEISKDCGGKRVAVKAFVKLMLKHETHASQAEVLVSALERSKQ